jgi:hypothetical protein
MFCVIRQMKESGTRAAGLYGLSISQQQFWYVFLYEFHAHPYRENIQILENHR